MRLLVSLSLVFWVSCAHRPPDIEACSIVNFDVAECTPTDPGESSYDKDLRDMLAYTCLSPEDLGKIKAWLKKVLSDKD